MARSIAAGYYEYTPALFEAPGFARPGPDLHDLKRRHGVWPDFHHARDLEGSGRVVEFLPEAVADAFCLRGDPAAVAAQLVRVLRSAPAAFDHVVLHPIPDPVFPDDPERGFTARVARDVLPRVREALSRA
jgi:hypothetical protein